MTLTKERPRSGSGISGSGGKCCTCAQTAERARSHQRQVAEGLQHHRRVLHRPQQLAAVHLGRVDERQLGPDDDPEVATPAAQRPEQLGVAGAGHVHELAGGVDDVDRHHGVRGEPVLAREPRDAAAEGEADHAHVAVAAAEPDQAGAVELGHQCAPLDAGTHGDGAAGEVELDALERAGAQQQRAVEGGAGGVTGGLCRHRHAVLGAPADGGHDVVGVRDVQHRGRALRHVDDPRRAVGVVGGVVGRDEAADDGAAQGVPVGADGGGGGGRGQGGHEVLLDEAGPGDRRCAHRGPGLLRWDLRPAYPPSRASARRTHRRAPLRAFISSAACHEARAPASSPSAAWPMPSQRSTAPSDTTLP